MDENNQDLNTEQELDPTLSSPELESNSENDISDTEEVEGEGGESEEIDPSLDEIEAEEKKKFDPKTATIPYSKWKEDYENAKFWREVAEGKRQNPYQTQAQNTTPTVPKTPEEIKAEQEAEGYRAEIKKLGFTSNEEVKVLEEKLAKIEESLANGEKERRIQETDRRLKSEAAELSKKYNGADGTLKFNYRELATWAVKEGKLPLLRAGFSMEDLFILKNKHEWASTMTQGSKPSTPSKTKVDNGAGGEMDFSKMTSQQLEEYLAKKNGR